MTTGRRAWEKMSTDAGAVPVAVDVDCSARYATFGVDQAKTAARARTGGGGVDVHPWPPDHHPRAHWIRTADIPYAELGVTIPQVGAMVGNAAAVPVIGNVLSNAFVSAGLTCLKVPFPQI